MADDEFPLILTLAELRMDAQYVRWMIALKGDEERPAREQLLRTLEERISSRLFSDRENKSTPGKI
jgi:hypothetical protein